MAELIKLAGQAYKTTFGEDDIIIGKETDALSFTPQITFTKWNKENSLTFKFPDIITPTIPSLTNKELNIGDTKIGFYFSPQNDDISFKFGIILKEKPLTNKFTFQLENWEDWDFFYQPPLTEEWKIGDMIPFGESLVEIANVTPNQVLDSNGNIIINRTDKVVGSYAVYHKTKKNYEVGKTNYQTGRIGCIFKPQVLDADGKTVGVGDLHIEDGLYTLTVDQKILDEAKYPIKFNDEFGYHPTSGGTELANQGYYASFAYAASTPASDGTLTSMSLHCKYYSTSAKFNPALYTNASTLPVTRLAYLDDGGTSIGVDYSWITTNLSYGSLVSGTQYWLGMKGDTGVGRISWHYDSGSPDARYQAVTGYPATVGSTSAYGSGITWIYATFTSNIAVALTGTVTTANENDIVAGGKTIILTVTGDTFVATVGQDNAITTALIAGIDSAQSEATGWDAVVKAHMVYTDVVRTSSTVITITLGDEATYNITAKETITVTVPASALTGGNPLVATPTFDIGVAPLTNSIYESCVNTEG